MFVYLFARLYNERWWKLSDKGINNSSIINTAAEQTRSRLYDIFKWYPRLFGWITEKFGFLIHEGESNKADRDKQRTFILMDM